MLIDSHCHLDKLDLDPFGGRLESVLKDAERLDVKGFLCVGVELTEYHPLLELVEPYPNVWLSIGAHPCDVKVVPDVTDLQALCEHPKVVALGETGLDYYHTEHLNPDIQQKSFRAHIQAARAAKVPLVVHTREAREDTIRILQEEHAEECRGVLHCFTEDWAMASQALDLGFYISFSGIVTFKNALTLKEVARKVPLDSILVETDSPWLAPIPYRGKPNYPGYTRYVAEYMATLRGISFVELAQKTTHNFYTLFAKAR